MRDLDEIFMKKAILEAHKGRGFTSPNPCVGAMIVKGGKIIGKGYHKKAGEDHAEIAAIKDALGKAGGKKPGFKKLAGSTLYVNLEPCCHIGKTGPCVEEIVKYKIKRVVVSHSDPSKKVNCKGIEALKSHGIEVKVGVCEEEARMVNQPFLKVSKTGIPFVTLKAGISLDGRISTGTGKPEWITNELSRNHGYKLREFYDCIVVGANTVIIDNPFLRSKKGRLFRVIIDGALRVDISSKVFRDENCFIAYTERAKKSDVVRFKKAGIKIECFGKNKVDLKKLLKYLLEKFDIQSIFVEGGGEVNGSFADAKKIDDVYFYIAPEIIGGRNAISVVEGNGVKSVKDDLKIKSITVRMLKGDILVHGIINEY